MIYRSMAFHSFTARIAFTWAFHATSVRKVRVAVKTTRPVTSPEQSLSLSSEMYNEVIWSLWLLRMCFGEGGGGAGMVLPKRGGGDSRNRKGVSRRIVKGKSAELTPIECN